jgi:glycosyltransferase involved in cell wall biosynthesis
VDKIFLSVVIPCFDEMANLQKGVLEKINHYLDKKKIPYEVIVVDDGSKDGSIQFTKEFLKEHDHFILIDNSHLGKAGAVTTGMLRAKGEYILFTDMDQATPIEELNNLLPYIEKDFDIVIGSRNSTRKGAPWTRVLMAKGMILLRSILIGLNGIKDTQCGFKLFKRAASLDLFTEIRKIHNGFHAIDGSNVTAGFDIELLYLAQEKGYKIKEVPVNWLYVETRRVNPIRDSIEGLRSLFLIKKNALTGKYKNTK